ncbi:fumarate lyase [Catenulispora acidiphila DSM 44928]|uniref:Fumarate lyase n=2 Tax=Catenulispora TaxID=414878 RepID=C7Q1L9_CATAD|nr:lyase family protein [Catenulispora acidiphila]ACU73748.1 fumarate lyase [Catenulispora acidiphila DSM 44928]
MTSADVGLLAPVWAGTTVEEATGDPAFLQAMLDAEAALTRAQAALGQAPDAAAAAITAAARAENFDLRDIALRARTGGNPVIPLAADLTAAVPAAAAPFVHHGATSQDILDTAMMLIAARAIATVQDDLRRTADTLATLAAAHQNTPMPGRTLTQHAVPTTFGLKAAGWRTLILDSMDRLATLHLPAQLGGAAGTLAAFEVRADAIDHPEDFSRRSPLPGSGSTPPGTTIAHPEDSPGALPLSASQLTPSQSSVIAQPEDLPGASPLPMSAPTPPPGSAIDYPENSPGRSRLSMSQLTPSPGSTIDHPEDSPRRSPTPGSAIDLPGAFARELGLAVPELPWHVLRTPVADLGGALAFAVGAMAKVAADVLVLSRTEVGEVAEGAAGGSSAMPHKANPVRATLIAAAARQAPALAAVLFGALVAEDERPAGAWHAEWQPLRELLRLAGGAAEAAAGLVAGLRVLPDRMLDNLHRTRGLVVSERLAAEVSGVLGRGPAKQLLADAADRVGSLGTSLEDVLADAPELKGLISRDRLRRLTDPADYLGAAEALVDRALRRMPPPTPPRKNCP